MTTRADRIAGALLGVHAGDALGASKEFSPWGGGRYLWPAGHVTDDVGLTRAVLQAYLHPSVDVVETAAVRMVEWIEQHPSGRAARADKDEAGNGSLIRCIPTALAVRDRERRIQESIDISAITHDDPRCTSACAVYNEIAAALLDATSPREAVDLGNVLATELGVTATATALTFGTRLKPGALVRSGQTFAGGDTPGYVLDALSLAVAAVLDERPLPDVLADVVRLSTDADSNGAIAGGLLGARDGFQAIPEQWLSVLQFADEFTAAAITLAEFTGR